MHIDFITHFRNSPKPNFPDQNPLLFFTHDLLRLIRINIINMLLLISHLMSHLRVHIPIKSLSTKLLSLIGILVLDRLVGGTLVGRILRLFLVEGHAALGLWWVVGHLALAWILNALLHVLETVIVLFYVHFPLWLCLIHSLDYFVADVFSASNHGKGIAKSVEGASSISFNDPT